MQESIWVNLHIHQLPKRKLKYPVLEGQCIIPGQSTHEVAYRHVCMLELNEWCLVVMAYIDTL